MGQGVASFLHLYSPDMLVMGSGLSERFGALESGIIESLCESSIPAFRDTPARKASCGTDSGLLGAANLVCEPA